jgi:hypothetical protein
MAVPWPWLVENTRQGSINLSDKMTRLNFVWPARSRAADRAGQTHSLVLGFYPTKAIAAWPISAKCRAKNHENDVGIVDTLT